ncbi:nibrin isoform X2 [Octopus bimaculoides]|uniref:nibrin isoform X2 n=1 Tax=Octopus bimaculoides TaxID=37653 RepID=UPI00071DB730|nr:nibrin isoform X2 [Octopus bimaculoides]|eukprot:XP_014778711.1 PREDICTED: nibrin-like isoform X2 [Octopus bimaculoides]
MELKIPYTKSSLTIQDVSSYGTYINRKKCNQNTAIELKEGDKLMFGSPKSTFWVRFNPLVVTSSCLKNSAKLELDQVMKYFDGKVANEWSDKCNFLVMDYISVTVKVVCALAAQCQIVTIDYFKSLKTASELSQPYKGPEEFLPKLSPNFVIKNGTFQPNPLRKTLFSGITFYFLKSSQLRKMKMAIELAGGHSCLCASKPVDDSTLVKDTSIVMQAEPSEDEWVSHVLSLLLSHSKRMITDAEIGQAILCCNTEKYCNPNAALAKTFSQLPSQTVKFHSQQTISTHTQDSLMFLNQSNIPKESVKMPNPSTNIKATESSFPSSDAPESKIVSNKRSRSPDKPENPFSAKVDDKEPSNKKTRLFAESVPDNTNPGSSIKREPSVQILAPDSLSQAPLIKPQPILVIEDSDPEDVSSENEDQNSKNVPETTSDKLKQSNLSNTLIDSESTEAAPGTEILTPVSIKKEVVDSTYEHKKHSKPSTLDLFSEDSQLKDKQGKITENSTKFTDVYIKPGYLNTKFTTVNTTVKIKQEIKKEEDLPKSCAAISFTNLVHRQPKPPPPREKTNSKDAPQGFAYYKGALVRNFKNFRKNSNSGACSLPKVIGGSDLAVHNPTISKDLDEWFKEASVKESQENEEIRKIEKLFNWGPNKKGSRKR